MKTIARLVWLRLRLERSNRFKVWLFISLLWVMGLLTLDKSVLGYRFLAFGGVVSLGFGALSSSGFMAGADSTGQISFGGRNGFHLATLVTYRALPSTWQQRAVASLGLAVFSLVPAMLVLAGAEVLARVEVLRMSISPGIWLDILAAWALTLPNFPMGERLVNQRVGPLFGGYVLSLFTVAISFIVLPAAINIGVGMALTALIFLVPNAAFAAAGRRASTLRRTTARKALVAPVPSRAPLVRLCMSQVGKELALAIPALFITALIEWSFRSRLEPTSMIPSFIGIIIGRSPWGSSLWCAWDTLR